MTKGSGVTLILFGIVTFIDSYTTSLTAKFIYILAILAILVGFVVYLKKKCIKEINTKIKQGMGDKNLPCLFCLREFIKKY